MSPTGSSRNPLFFIYFMHALLPQDYPFPPYDLLLFSLFLFPHSRPQFSMVGIKYYYFDAQVIKLLVVPSPIAVIGQLILVECWHVLRYIIFAFISCWNLLLFTALPLKTSRWLLCLRGFARLWWTQSEELSKMCSSRCKLCTDFLWSRTLKPPTLMECCPCIFLFLFRCFLPICGMLSVHFSVFIPLFPPDLLFYGSSTCSLN